MSKAASSVLVPVSPPKVAKLSLTLDRKYAEQRQNAFYNSLSSRTSQKATEILEPHVGPRQSTSFIASSSKANRNATVKAKKSSSIAAKKKANFTRDNEAGFGVKAAHAGKTPQVKSVEEEMGDRRDEALRLVEDLTIGPKRLEPPEDDVYFLKLEPTSGIALRKRYILHRDFEPHLEGRYYLPISTLYSIAEPGQSDDGDFTLPVAGDWLTMGVITAKSKVLFTKEKKFDALGRLIKDDDKPFMEDDKPASQVAGEESVQLGHAGEGHVTGRGERKKWTSKRYFIVTLIDLSHRPDKYGDHDGSQEMELSVFESDSTWVEAGGERKYSGGSFGAYEKLSTAGMGALVCIMNPRIRNAKSHNTKKPIYRLNPRTGKTIMIVGMSKDYKMCGVGDCENFVDDRTGVDVCTFHLNSKLSKTRNGRSEVQNSWRQSTEIANPFALSNGMSLGPKLKPFIIETDDSHDPNDCTSRKFDVQAHYGRVKEERAQQDGKLKDLMDLNRKLKKSKPLQGLKRKSQVDSMMGDENGELRLIAMLRRKNSERAIASKQEMGKLRTPLDVLNTETAGSKVIEAARKAMQEKKRLDEREKMHDQKKGRDGVVLSTIPQQHQTCDPDVPSGSYRAHNGDIKRLTASSSRLLARHSADSSSIVKPLLNRKRIKLPPSVRPPPGESFYASESSDEELELLMRSEAMEEHLQEPVSHPTKSMTATSSMYHASDSDSDLEIIPTAKV